MVNLLYKVPWSVQLESSTGPRKFEVKPQNVIFEVRQVAVRWTFAHISGKPDPPPPLDVYLGNMFWIPLQLNMQAQAGTQLVSPMSQALSAGTYELFVPPQQGFTLLISGWLWVYDSVPYSVEAELETKTIEPSGNLDSEDPAE